MPAPPFNYPTVTDSGGAFIIPHVTTEGQLFFFASDRRTVHIAFGEPAVTESWTRVGVRPSSRTGGEPTIDQGAGPCRSKAMADHGIHSLAFKKQVVQEYAAGATLNALAREHDLSRTP